MTQPEFYRYSPSYEELLKDPIRDRFMGQESGFFHERKRDLIREHFRRAAVDTHKLRYLDVGCGKGELISLLRDDFVQLRSTIEARNYNLYIWSMHTDQV